VETDSLRRGKLLHALVLEPDRAMLDFAVWRGGRRAGGEWEGFKLANAGRCLVTEDEYGTARDMRDAIKGHTVAADLLALAGSCEASAQWQHKSGRPCKVRFDKVGSGLLLDLKTTRDVSPQRFAADAVRFGYHAQMAFYYDAAVALGMEVQDVRIIAVESAPPHDVVVYAITDDVLAVGRAQYEAAIEALGAAEKSGKWPGMASETVELALPTWALPEQEELELTFDGEVI
jgi:exodeoxyribonuclease VIII